MLHKLPKDFIAFHETFRAENGDSKLPPNLPGLYEFRQNLAKEGTFDLLDIKLLARFAKKLKSSIHFSEIMRSEYADRCLDFLSELQAGDRPTKREIAGLVLYYRVSKSELAEDGTAEAPFKSERANEAWKTSDQDMLQLLEEGELSTTTLQALSRYRPDVLSAALKSRKAKKRIYYYSWEAILEGSDRFDDAFMKLAAKELHGDRADEFFNVFCKLNTLRNDAFIDDMLEMAPDPRFSSLRGAVDALVRHQREEAPSLILAGFKHHLPFSGGEPYLRLYPVCLEQLEGDGGLLLRTLLTRSSGSYTREELIKFLVTDAAEEHEEGIRNLFRELTAEGGGQPVIELWQEIAKHPNNAYLPEFRKHLSGKSKQLRETAAKFLKDLDEKEAFEHGKALLASKKANERIGGIIQLQVIGGSEAIQLLEAAQEGEKGKQVLKLLREVLASAGVEAKAEPVQKEEPITGLADFEARVAKKPKSAKLPKSDWLNFDALPPLFSTDGTELAPLTVNYVIQQQARAKKVVLAEEVAPLLSFLDRDKNAPFAHAVLDQWFDKSKLDAKSQWILGLVGITGDSSLIPRLTENIDQWCGMNRGALAQWVVQSVSLLGSDEALATLDSLGHKYRSKRKYVGAAAREAIATTAAMRGMTLDDLEDLVVPTFDFDGEGRRPFETSDGEVFAVLQPDFKLAWFNPKTEKETKSTPGNLTDEAKAKLKDLRKFLRESVKAQGLRLERLMVQQRRWPVARWRELFEQQPLLFTFAARLVWGVFDSENKLLRTFRRYPNGLLAHADGDLEELAESGTQIGLVHPLELEAKSIEEWLSHLQRFKVKPSFAQIDRPVETLDPNHGNRREISFTDELQLPAGTLRSRCEKHGWVQGATGDGGYVYTFYKPFPTGGIEVYLQVREFAAFSGFDQEVTLGPALIARRSPDERRSEMEEPDDPADPRVLSFGEVPAIVYSETISDLKAITASSS